MLAGVKIMPRNEVNKEQGEDLNCSTKDGKRSGDKRVKEGRKKKKYSYSSSDDEAKNVKKGLRKNKNKWYSSEEYSSSNSSHSESEGSYEHNKHRHENKKKGKTRSRSKRKHYSSESCSDSENERDGGSSAKKGRHGKRQTKKEEHGKSKEIREGIEGDSRKSQLEAERKTMGMEWMLRPADNAPSKSTIINDQPPEEPLIKEIKSANPRELNPYLKDSGFGYPEEEDEIKANGDKLLPTSVVGDGGASWRLKALKRAQEQATREGRKLEEVAGERWGSLGQLAVSVSSGGSAPFRAHLQAIHHRKRGQIDDHSTVSENQNEKVKEKSAGRDYLKNISVRHPDMKLPKARDSLSWGKTRGQNLREKDAIVSAMASSLNKFENNGSFLREFCNEQKSNLDNSHVSSSSQSENYVELKHDLSDIKKQSEVGTTPKQPLSANQLAAKVMQLRMKGKHKEADDLLTEAENNKANQSADNVSIRPQTDGGTNRYITENKSAQRKNEDDADLNLAQKLVQNKKFSISGQADDEYDYDDGTRKKAKKKGDSSNRNSTENNCMVKRILTQQERCQFCFENPKRPKHLVVSIANFTYLMLPQGAALVPGHCCILPLQHESSTRTVDNNVWDEIRNFKKCLIMMFAKQEKEVVFLETVVGLAKQQRHCMIECIPLPQAIAKQAPLYFKKAIDEAEDEWSQHNAKKLIDTSVKGLRSSIPKDFPYFHVEFGLNKGFVHVIDDEQQFKTSLGLNVIRGMLQLPEEDMYRRRRHESVEAQNKSVASFAKEWEPFDWTKQL